MIVNNEQEVLQLVKDLREASERTRHDLLFRSTIDSAYYEGCQWIASNGKYGTAKAGRLITSLNPDRGKLRVTLNRVTRNIIRVSTSTHPSQIVADVAPRGKRFGPDDFNQAKLLETMLQGALDATGFLGHARTANHRRCIGGTFGIGFSLDSTVSMRDVEGQQREVPDVRMRAMVFPAHHLSLDPAVDSHNLCDHDAVLYTDIWTKTKAERVLGVTLNKEDCQEIGQLAQHEIAMNELVGDSLYDKYRRDSKSLGVRVHQLHVKDEDDRFGQMFIVIESKAEKKVVNADDPSTPFGGNAMPLGLIRAHRRANVHWGLSDVAMIATDQDILNLHATLYHRVLQSSGRPKWLVDPKTLGRSVSMEDTRRILNNEVGGVVPLDMGRASERRYEPRMIDLPGPQPHLIEGQREAERGMQEGAFRAEGHLGQTKSHVANASFDRALEEADAPIGIRMQEDIETYQSLFHCLLGTEIKSAQMQSYSTVRSLVKLGMDEMDLGTILQTDPNDAPVKISIRESSVRYRGPLRRRQDLEGAVQLGAANATEYRLAMAQDMDTPIAHGDAVWAQEASKIAQRVVLGQPFQPMSAGPVAGQWILNALRMALVDPRARDPQIRQNLDQAIALQQQMNLMDAIASDPALAMQQQQAAQQGGQQAQALPDEVDLSEILAG